MAKSDNTKNKNGLLRNGVGTSQKYAAVLWQLVMLGAQGLGSFKLYECVADKQNYSFGDYVIIVAATVLAVNVLVRIAQLVSKEATHDRNW